MTAPLLDRDHAERLATSDARSLDGCPVDLRGFTPDPKLFDYVTFHEAVAAVVCPYMLVGDVLVIAAASSNPDLEGARRLFPALTIEVAPADREEIVQALWRAGRGGAS